MVRVYATALFLGGMQALVCSFLGPKIKFCNLQTKRAKSQKEGSLALSRITCDLFHGAYAGSRLKTFREG